ncbi:MAG: hypothetical protein P8I94_06700 [Emcibacteraceae bacterium]|nr:hypothetical protein [Emcibacteraceae bacterium]
MDWLFFKLSEDEIYGWETYIGDWFFVFALAFLAFELVRYLFLKKMSWKLAGDTVTNYITLGMYIGLSFFLAALYITAYSWASQFALFNIENTWLTVIICIV